MTPAFCLCARDVWYTVYQDPMNIHEYQAKQLLAKYGVPLAHGGVAFTPEEAEKVAGDMGGTGWAVKVTGVGRVV